MTEEQAPRHRSIFSKAERIAARARSFAGDPNKMEELQREADAERARIDAEVSKARVPRSVTTRIDEVLKSDPFGNIIQPSSVSKK